MYAEVYEFIKLHDGEVKYTELLRWLKNWYGIDAKNYLDKLLIKYDKVFEFTPRMSIRGVSGSVPAMVRLIE